MSSYFEYGEEATGWLSRKDRRMAWAISRIGHVSRAVDGDLFSAVVHHIIGQQISTKAQQTVWRRLQEAFGEVSAASMNAASEAELQRCGMTFRKAGCIKDFARRVTAGEFDCAAVEAMPDGEAVKALTSLRGIGEWTAEMILLFCLQRPDVLSYGDLAIRRGIRMLYRHRNVDRALFEKYRRRFSPFGSVASLYLWAIACGALPELSDPGAAPKASAGRRAAGKKKTEN